MGCDDNIPDLSCILNRVFFTVRIFGLKKDDPNSDDLGEYTYQNKGKCNIDYPRSIPYVAPRNYNQKSINLIKSVELLLEKNSYINLVVGDGSQFKISKVQFSDWISTDKDVLDIRNSFEVLSIIPLNSVKFIHMNHVFEHIQYYEIPTTLININKILMVGGELFLSVPDHYDRVNINFI